MCGIFGIINSGSKHFDYQTFCTLGICNDERGGDSCGIFIDGEYEYGVDKEKLFLDFYRKSVLLNKTTKCHIAFGHCRKASVGAINIKTAQPVIIENNGKVEFVLIHNGTIYNYEKLAKKYIPNIDITGMTDSQVMAQIFYHEGYDVLKEYNGGGAFVIADYRGDSPKVFMFKGASLASYNAVTPIDERPLFVIFRKDSVIFSSTYRFMRLKKNDGELYTCPSNKLCIVDEKSKLLEVKEYDRSDRYQFRSYDYETNNYYRDYGRYRYDDDYEGSCYQTPKQNFNYPSNSGNSNNNDNKNKVLLISGKSETSKERILVSNNDGTYNVDNVLAQGFYFMNHKGKITSAKDKDKDRIHVFFFWQGVLLYNKECYKFLKKLANIYHMTEGQLIEDYPILVHSLSPDPFRDNQIFRDNKMRQAISSSEWKLFKGEQWQYLMSNKCFYFDDEGEEVVSWDCDQLSIEATFDDYARLSDTYIDFSYLIDELKVY